MDKVDRTGHRDPALLRLLLEMMATNSELCGDEDTSPEALDCMDAIATAFETYTQRMKLDAGTMTAETEGAS